MIPTPPIADAATVADRYLQALSEQGARWLFCNAGTDFPPLIEAYGKAMARGETVPDPILVPHENVAIAMAYGAALMTQSPQVVMVHVGLGTANALCGLINAAKQRIPIILTAGRTPVLEQGRLGARNNYINWAQEMYDQGGMVREFVKWDYELRDPAQVDAVVDRAFALSASSPPGPAYLVLPREVLSAPAASSAPGHRRAEPARAPRPREQDVRQAADWLAAATFPVIVTSDVGRSSAAFHELDRLAREWSIPVVQYRPRHANMATDHPMFCGYDPAPWVERSDCVIVLESDVPWIPESCGVPASCKLVHVGLDPLYGDYPMRSFASDLSICCDAAAFLADLHQALGQRGTPNAQAATARHAAVARLGDDTRDTQAVPVGLNHRYVSRVLAELFDDDTVLINEYPFALEELPIRRPASVFTLSQAGGLGWALGMALGVKLATPQATIVAAVGDGCYMFGNPTPAHFVARARGLPFLTVIFNNRRWAAVHRSTLSMFPDGTAARSENPPLSSLEPAPDYETIVTACGGFGARVDHVDQLRGVLQEAMAAVRGGRQAVVNVLTEASYTRTS